MKQALMVILLTFFVTTCYAQWRLELPENYPRQKQQTKKAVQQKQATPWFDKSKLTFGGQLGAHFGDYTLINIAPQVGYNFSQYFNAGLGFTYTHWNEKYYLNSEKYKEINNFFGFNVYGRFYPISNIVLMVQPEINRVWQKIKDDNRDTTIEKDETFVPACVVGAGLRLGPISAMLQYDVVQHDKTPYGRNIFYSMGYTFNF
ncbi:hypothetical protein [Dysgonomonas sp. 216]|uniref:hypothetical protein n=1 Tax=Dysgonomonas sp. 216 TaxID=2302934 RepID=UPI0013D50F79|nr:hypothetical protein [Dysgonomonas sp. 216]